MQNIVFITSGGISKVENRNIVAVILFDDSSVVSCNVAFCISWDKRHSACTGKLYVRIQKVCSLADSCRSYHKSMDVAGIHKCNSFLSRTSAPDHSSLNNISVGTVRNIFSLTPFVRLEWQRDKSPLDFCFCRPPSCSVLSVSDFFCLYSVKRLVVKQIYYH